jgi:hypothetical protein
MIRRISTDTIFLLTKMMIQLFPQSLWPVALLLDPGGRSFPILASKPHKLTLKLSLNIPRLSLLHLISLCILDLRMMKFLGVWMNGSASATTRKTATRGALKMVTRSALSVRHGYHATGTRLPAAHGWCATGNLLTCSAPPHALWVIWSMRCG